MKKCYRVLTCSIRKPNEIVFSSGPSDSDDDDLQDLTEEQKRDRAKELWRLNFNLAKMAHKTTAMYQEISKDFVIYTDGDFERCTSKQKEKMFGSVEELAYKEKEKYTAKPKWYILLPSAKFMIAWNLIVVVLL
jgi:hypothetical protein